MFVQKITEFVLYFVHYVTKSCNCALYQNLNNTLTPYALLTDTKLFVKCEISFIQWHSQLPIFLLESFDITNATHMENGHQFVYTLPPIHITEHCTLYTVHICTTLYHTNRDTCATVNSEQ